MLLFEKLILVYCRGVVGLEDDCAKCPIARCSGGGIVQTGHSDSDVAVTIWFQDFCRRRLVKVGTARENDEQYESCKYKERERCAITSDGYHYCSFLPILGA